MKLQIQELVERYEEESLNEKRNIIKEVMQELILFGLSQANFFDCAAFYGGTALRIFYGLERFSEDLDFSLLSPNLSFDLSVYFPKLKSIIESFGMLVEIEIKEKSKETMTESAFLKTDTIEQFLIFYPNINTNSIQKSEKIKIKFEVDINPPKYATYETKYLFKPSPYSILAYDESSLFAGKLHAVLCRAWKSRVKGRDLYDYVFYLSKKIPFNLSHLKERLIQTGYITENDCCTLEDVKEMLIKKFEEIDFKEAKNDVQPFIADTKMLDLWCKEFFVETTKELKAK